MHVEIRRNGGLDLVEKLAELRGAVAPVAFADHPTVAMSRAANSEVVPWRL